MSDSEPANNPWSQSPQELAKALHSDLRSGISEAEVLKRREQHGLNKLPVHTGPSMLSLILSQFKDWMVAMLGVAAVLSAVIGDLTDSILIGLIVLANATIGFFQEWKAEKAVEALRKMSQPVAEVIRSGHIASVPAEELVPGDLIRLKAGDSVPADARIVEATDSEADESPLTGESHPAEKNTKAANNETPLADRHCMVYCGTAITRGHLTGLVTDTGQHTELGRIAGMISRADEGPTPLQKRLSRLSGQLAIVVLFVCVAIFVTGILREPSVNWNQRLFSEMLLMAISLAVAAIPEGLPAIVTVVLALGSQRMARRNAIVRKLSAVETLGSVGVICSDKTGTLTQNTMTVAGLVPTIPEQDNNRDAAESGLLTAASLCNNAGVDGDGTPVGSATETALLKAGQSRQIDIRRLRERWPKLQERPFSSERKRMSTLHRSEGGKFVVLVKGAAERILEHCTALGFLQPGSLLLETSQTAFDRAHWTNEAEAMANQGHRVLAVAARYRESNSPINDDESEKALVLLGLITIEDPVRPEAAAAIAKCQTAGIRTLMITGDHISTARSIADSTGLLQTEGEAITGRQLDEMSDEDLRTAWRRISVFARVTPEHKLRIVRAFQADGAIVAMTGDGVNDGPALKQADIGVAMGITGTDVARESADMILADDNFATIVAAVEEGRVVYDNIRKFIAYLLTANAGEIIILFLAVLGGLPIPLLPVQILWINLVTDGLPALALGFEDAEKDIMQHEPRGRESGVFGDGLAWMVLGVGTLMGLLGLGLFLLLYDRSSHDSTLLTARTAVFTSVAFSQLFYVLAIRSHGRTLWQLGIWSNYRIAWAVVTGMVLQLLLIYVEPLNRFFHTTPLSAGTLALSVGLAAIPFLGLETWKLIKQAQAR